MDADFLSSIEIVMIYRCEVILMQNPEHLITIFELLNQLPKKSHETDFSRVRDYFLNGWGKHFRQSIFISEYLFPELNMLWKQHCASKFSNFYCHSLFLL